jgi:septal ring factor EnvC (AmiA/AmiB activator)
MIKTTRGKRVSSFLLFFTGAVLLVFGAILFYELKDKSSFDEIKAEINELRQEIKSISDVANGNSNSVANLNLRLNAMEEVINSFKNELDVFRDQTSETREKQIKMQDALSKKRPVLKVPSPIIFEIMTPTKKKALAK